MTDAAKIIAGRYEIISQIGVGGISVVYKAFDKTLNNDVALKMVLHPEAITAEQLRRFQLEAKIASNLRHENLIRVLDFGITSKNEPFLVMDFVVGITLQDYVEQQGPMPISRALDIFVQMCDGMEQAHAQNVLHRDLKSANIMLLNIETAKPKVVILDFGLAKIVEKADSTVTRPGVAIGTPFYMSPEHARGTALDARSDIYSLGCIMFETLCGSPPFDSEAVVETIMHQISEQPPTMHQKNPSIDFSPKLENIVATTLEKDPAKRYQTMADLRNALNSVNESDAALSLFEPEPVSTVSEPIKGHGIALHIVLPAVAILLIAAGTIGVGIMNHKDIEVPKLQSDAKDSTGLFGEWSDWRWEDDFTWYKRFGVTDEDLVKEHDSLAKHEYISLWNESISAKGLRAISDLPLKGIYLKQTGASGKELRIVSEMKTIDALNLDDLPRLQDKDMELLLKLPKLRLLSLRNDNITDEGLKTIGKMKSLEFLNLDKTNIKGYGLAYLKDLPKLKKLRLATTHVPADSINLLSDLKGLTELNLHDTLMDGSNLPWVTSLPLVILDVGNTRLKDADLPKLKAIKTLKSLFIEDHPDRGVTKKGMESLARGWPSVDVIAGRYQEKPKNKNRFKFLPQ